MLLIGSAANAVNADIGAHSVSISADKNTARVLLNLEIFIRKKPPLNLPGFPRYLYKTIVTYERRQKSAKI